MKQQHTIANDTVKDEGYKLGELPTSLTLLVTGTGHRSNDDNKETLLLRSDDHTVHLHKEAHPHIIHNMVDRYNEHERLLAANKELIDICSTILAISALERMERFDISDRLKKAVLKATAIQKHSK